jgi:TPR repeat protein
MLTVKSRVIFLSALLVAVATTGALASQDVQTARDYSEGARLSERAAFAPNKREQVELATKALTYLRRAADAGHVDARYQLGLIYAGFMLGEVNEPAALQWFLSAADAGHVHAQLEVALAYYNGKGTTIDRVSAARWYERAAESGDMFAANKLMLMLHKGDGIPKNEARAIELMRKVAASGSPPTLTALGEMLEWADDGLKKLDEAEAAYRKASNAGEPRAQYRLGLMLERRGQFNEASRLYAESENRRFGIGAYRLGRMYEYGLGVSKDPQHARKNYEIAYRNLPSPVKHFAVERLAYLYRNGLGGPANVELANKLEEWAKNGPARFDQCKNEWREKYDAKGGRCEWLYENDLK